MKILSILSLFLGLLAVQTSAFQPSASQRRSIEFAPKLAKKSSQQVSSKERLLSLLAETPRNLPTPRYLTNQILEEVRRLEQCCPTDPSDVLKKLAGTWELLWTVQDPSAPESKRLFSYINPLENQSYSNNPSGRLNPFLPRAIQDRLEASGLVSGNANRSTQSIDTTKQVVRNVVSFGLPGKRKVSLTVTVDFTPNKSDPRRVDVKFKSCRVVVQGTPIDIDIPLGIIGPTGWLRTGYIDDTMRITRGHKGSVFVLARPSKS